MLPHKLRTAKVQARLFTNNTDAISQWRAAQVARGVINTIGKLTAPTLTVDELDCAIIRAACKWQGQGRGLAFNPFSGGRALCGNTMTVSMYILRHKLGLEKRDGRNHNHPGHNRKMQPV